MSKFGDIWSTYKFMPRMGIEPTTRNALAAAKEPRQMNL